MVAILAQNLENAPTHNRKPHLWILIVCAVLAGLIFACLQFTNRAKAPLLIPVVSGPPVAAQRPAQIALSDQAGLLLAPDGRLWFWGNYRWSTVGTVPPNLTPSLLDPTNRWTRLAGGSHHFLVIRDDGTLWGLGANFYGQLGNPPGTDSNLVQLSPATNWIEIAAGSRSSLGLQRDGTLWAWGGNHLGSLGLGDPTPNVVYPIRQVSHSERWRAIGINAGSCWAIHTNGTLWGWGEISSGQIRTRPEPFTPVAPWEAIGTGGQPVALVREGKLYLFPSSPGPKTPGNREPLEPTPIANPSDPLWTRDLFTAGDAVFARQSDGSWWAMGANTLGRFGVGNPKRLTSMTRLPWPKETLALDANTVSSYAFLADGSLWHTGWAIDSTAPANNSGLASRFVKSLNAIGGMLMGADTWSVNAPHSRYPVKIWTWPSQPNHQPPTTNN